MEENKRIFKMSDYEHLRKSKDKGENISLSEYFSGMQDELENSENCLNSENQGDNESDRYENDHSNENFEELEKISKMGDSECKKYLDDMLQNNFTRFLSVMEAQADFDEFRIKSEEFFRLKENKLNNSENYDNTNLKNLTDLTKEDLNNISTTEYLSLMEDQLEEYR